MNTLSFSLAAIRRSSWRTSRALALSAIPGNRHRNSMALTRMAGKVLIHGRTNYSGRFVPVIRQTCLAVTMNIGPLVLANIGPPPGV
jgi:hypothetical protein